MNSQAGPGISLIRGDHHDWVPLQGTFKWVPSVVTTLSVNIADGPSPACSWGMSCSSCFLPESAKLSLFCWTNCCSWAGLRPARGELCSSCCICWRPGGSRGSWRGGDILPGSESLGENNTVSQLSLYLSSAFSGLDWFQLSLFSSHQSGWQV